LNISSPGRTRTYDKAVNSRLLYQLSYRGILFCEGFCFVVPTGFAYTQLLLGKNLFALNKFAEMASFFGNRSATTVPVTTNPLPRTVRRPANLLKCA
jgi:hypothetical protein